jgi:hypothetical protein
MTRLQTLLLSASILAIAVTPSAAYYHYAHFLNSSSPYSVIYERFDLTQLPDSTVTFFVSDSGPTTYTPNDSFPSLLAQIRNATQVWNSVSTSSLRVAFGGLQVANTPQSVPTGEIVFDEFNGVLAYATFQVPQTVPAGSAFWPIQTSSIHLNVNFAQPPTSDSSDEFTGPSYSETFFTTLVHEIGHAIGLQHTYTASAMSTAVSRATNHARPLDDDDIASVSLLYPAAGFPAGYGAITGQVIMNGNPVNLASVVAIQPNGSAVSSLTLPDGTYEIDGLQPGTYWVYVHPVPPTANIAGPWDVNGNVINASAPFVSTFSPGPNTWDPSQFAAVAIAQGGSANINFSVLPRTGFEVYDVTSYSYSSAGTYNQPAYLNAGTPVQTVEAQGQGILSGNNTAVQTATALGGAPGGGYLPDYSQAVYADENLLLLAMYFNYQSTPGLGPEHLLFTMPDDIFVLPQAIQMVPNPPPSIAFVTPNGDGSVTVSGTNFNIGSQVYFDSLPGTITNYTAAASGQSATITAVPPPGASSQTATLTVFNSDGQNSMFVQSQSPNTFTYPPSTPPAAAISMSALPQGVTAMVRVTSGNMQFMDGLTTLGFGSGDVTVRHLWVRNSGEMWANVTVSPNAFERATVASVISGFQVYEQGVGFQVMPANPSVPIVNLPVSNWFPQYNSVFPGAYISITGQNLAPATGTTPPTITLTCPACPPQPVQVIFSSPTQVVFVVPARLASGVSMPTGPSVLTLFNGTISAYPLVLQVDPPPPVILSAVPFTGTTLAPGVYVTLTVSGMDPAVVANPSRVTVTEGGVNIPAFTITTANDGSQNLLIQLALTHSIAGPQVTAITVSQDGDLSAPAYITLSAPAGS